MILTYKNPPYTHNQPTTTPGWLIRAPNYQADISQSPAECYQSSASNGCPFISALTPLHTITHRPPPYSHTPMCFIKSDQILKSSVKVFASSIPGALATRSLLNQRFLCCRSAHKNSEVVLKTAKLHPWKVSLYEHMCTTPRDPKRVLCGGELSGGLGSHQGSSVTHTWIREGRVEVEVCVGGSLWLVQSAC